MWLLPAFAASIGEVEVHAPSSEERARAEELGLVFAEGVDGPWVRYHGDAESLERARQELTTRAYRADHRRLDRAEGYHTPDQVEDRLRELAQDPRAALVQLGESVQGRPIWGLRLGTAQGPAWRVLGAHHGDELSSTEVALALAAWLLEEGSLIERTPVWVVPAVNPDGMVAGSRYNARDVDLNRNYDFQWVAGFTHGESPFSEPEARAVRTLSLYAPFALGLSLHSGAENIGYPWNYTLEDPEDELRLEELSERYAERCSLPGFYATNGAAWYVTEGDTNDWSLGRLGTWDFTVELSEAKTPPAAELDAFLDAHLPALAEVMETPTLAGRVLSSTNGLGVRALVEVRGSAPVWTGPEGHFGRLLEVGVFEVHVSAPGFVPRTVEVGVGPEGAWEAIELQPEELPGWRLVPTLVSQATELVELRIEGVSPLPKRALLVRAGFDDVELVRDGDHYPLEPSALEQGPWTFVSDEGVIPNGLLVGAEDARVTVSGVIRLDSRLLLHGQGLADGTRAFAIWGDERTLVELPSLGGDESWRAFDVTAVPDGTVDLLVLSNGREVGIADLHGAIALDTAEPEPLDTEEPEAVRPGLVPAGYRECSSAAGSVTWTGWWLALFLLRRWT